MTDYTAKALLFDLDGTLIDSAPDICNSLNAVFRAMDLPAVSLKEVRNWIGKGAKGLLDDALNKTLGREPDATLVARAIHLFELYYAEQSWVKSVCYDGVLTGLSDLKDMGFRMACVTNKPRFLSLEVLKKSGLEGFFEVLVAGNDLNEQKPSGLPFLYAANQLGLRSTDCVVIGDSQNDIDAAKNSGIVILLVTWGYHQGLDMTQLHATQLINFFSEIQKKFISGMVG